MSTPPPAHRDRRLARDRVWSRAHDLAALPAIRRAAPDRRLQGEVARLAVCRAQQLAALPDRADRPDGRAAPERGGERSERRLLRLRAQGPARARRGRAGRLDRSLQGRLLRPREQAGRARGQEGLRQARHARLGERDGEGARPGQGLRADPPRAAALHHRLRRRSRLRNPLFPPARSSFRVSVGGQNVESPDPDRLRAGTNFGGASTAARTGLRSPSRPRIAST